MNEGKIQLIIKSVFNNIKNIVVNNSNFQDIKNTVINKDVFKNIKNAAIKKYINIKFDYGKIGLLACLLVPIKLLLFYKLIGVSSNLFFVWMVSCFFTYLLFSSIKNKWVAASIYGLFTILIFADVTYSSFFNRYLSLNMMGAAGVIDDIAESIKEVLKPSFFLLFADVIAIFVTLILKYSAEKQEISNTEKLEKADNNSYIAVYKSSEEKEIEEFLAKFNDIENSDEIDKKNNNEIENNSETIILEYNGEDNSNESFNSNKILRSKRRERKLFIKNLIKNNKKPIVALITVILMVFNVTGSFFITSISNQEIYSYHIKDIVSKITGKSMLGEGENYLYEFKDSYQTEKNGPLFGVAEGRNLIVIQMESLQNFVINREYNGQEITPNLNRLLKENTIYFDNYYQQVGSGNTSDAEFATNNSIYGTLASYTYKLYEDNYFRGLPVQLKDRGYETAVFHAHENRDFWNRENAYKSLGFDTYYGGLGGKEKKQYYMTEWMGWGLVDSEFFKQTMDYIKDLPEPFYSFIITISNHHPYIMLDQYQFLDLLPEDEDTIVGNYLNSAAYTDYAIGELIKELKAEGIYDNSIIALYGDHLGLAKTDEEIYNSMTRLLGKEYDFDNMMNIPLIITVPDAEKDIKQTVSISGGQMDFMPTIAYLMGFESLDTVYLGHNLLTIKSGFVAEQTYMKKGSFIMDDVFYEMSRDGVFENGRAWNKETGEAVSIEKCYDGFMRSMGIINTSEYILNNDVIKKIYVEHMDVGTAFNTGEVKPAYPDSIAVAGAPEASLIGSNSLEALNKTYEAGYRNIKVNICWTKDKEPVLLESWKNLKKYYETDSNEEISIKEFNRLKMKNKLTSLDIEELANWLKEHPDVKIIAKTERSSDYFMKTLNENHSDVFDRFIAEVPGMTEYTGLYASILNINIGGYTPEQIIEFVEMNNVPAITMNAKSASGKYKELLEQDCISYVEESEVGLLKRTN